MICSPVSLARARAARAACSQFTNLFFLLPWLSRRVRSESSPLHHSATHARARKAHARAQPTRTHITRTTRTCSIVLSIDFAAAAAATTKSSFSPLLALSRFRFIATHALLKYSQRRRQAHTPFGVCTHARLFFICRFQTHNGHQRACAQHTERERAISKRPRDALAGVCFFFLKWKRGVGCGEGTGFRRGGGRAGRARFFPPCELFSAGRQQSVIDLKS